MAIWPGCRCEPKDPHDFLAITPLHNYLLLEGREKVIYKCLDVTGIKALRKCTRANINLRVCVGTSSGTSMDTYTCASYVATFSLEQGCMHQLSVPLCRSSPENRSFVSMEWLLSLLAHDYRITGKVKSPPGIKFSCRTAQRG